MSNVIIYTTEDGAAKIELRLKNGTVWLSQAEIAELFQTTKQNISKHNFFYCFYTHLFLFSLLKKYIKRKIVFNQHLFYI